MEQSLTDTEWMLRAIALGMAARRIAPPNPWVGCVLVRDNMVVGEGHTQPAGGPHAEVMALRAAGENSRGATAYVSLEPCCHYGRTPPCTNALIEGKVSRVVIAQQDPDPRVRGQGVAALQAAGIIVITGVCADIAGKGLQPYIYQRQTGRPWCVVKAALSLDGRLAAKDGSSQWISGEEARTNAHELRADSQAILVGAGTACRDQPRLTVRHGVKSGPRPLLRVVLDAKGVVPASGPLFDPGEGNTCVFTTGSVNAQRKQEWLATGAQVVEVPAADDGHGVRLANVLDELGKQGIIQLLVEGGSQVYTALFRQELVNQLTIYYGPVLLGSEGLPFLGEGIADCIQHAPRLTLIHTETFATTIRADYSVRAIT